MKDIGGNVEKIARVHCTCCGYDKHFVDVFYNKLFDDGPDDYLFFLEFDVENDDYMYSELKHRMTETIPKIINPKNSRVWAVDSILITIEQMLELLSVISEYASKHFSSTSGTPNDIMTYPVGDNWYEHCFFKNKDGLMLLFEGDRITPSATAVNNFSIGWTYSRDYSDKYIRKNAINWLLKRGRTGIRKFEVSLSLSESMDFISSIEHIKNSIIYDKELRTYVI